MTHYSIGILSYNDMSLDETTNTVRVSDNAHDMLTEMARKNHVSVAFLVDYMIGKTKDKLEQLFNQKPKA